MAKRITEFLNKFDNSRVFSNFMCAKEALEDYALPQLKRCRPFLSEKDFFETAKYLVMKCLDEEFCKSSSAEVHINKYHISQISQQEFTKIRLQKYSNLIQEEGLNDFARYLTKKETYRKWMEKPLKISRKNSVKSAVGHKKLKVESVEKLERSQKLVQVKNLQLEGNFLRRPEKVFTSMYDFGEIAGQFWTRDNMKQGIETAPSVSSPPTISILNKTNYHRNNISKPDIVYKTTFYMEIKNYDDNEDYPSDSCSSGYSSANDNENDSENNKKKKLHPEHKVHLKLDKSQVAEKRGGKLQKVKNKRGKNRKIMTSRRNKLSKIFGKRQNSCSELRKLINFLLSLNKWGKNAQNRFENLISNVREIASVKYDLQDDLEDLDDLLRVFSQKFTHEYDRRIYTLTYL